VIFIAINVTQSGTDLFEKLIAVELGKKLPAFYRTRRLITVFTSPLHDLTEAK